ncbi:MAG: hypothetical protein KC502_06820 [Myxococcales bacterium]|nr:hypothetical protein [Myxococcales bacterium]
MTIDPKDLRRLVIRVVAVTLALRALHLFSVDMGGGEVAAAWALPAEGHSTPVLHLLLSAWRQICGGFAALVRTPALVADVALPLVAVAYARANGWGTLSGLVAGMILAVAPFGLDEGWRADGSPWLGLLAFAALWQLRVGLRRGETKAIGWSTLLLFFAALFSPMSLLVLPAGLYAIARSVTLARPRQVGAVGWLAAAAAGTVSSFSMTGAWMPGLDLASDWLAHAATNGGAPPLSAASGWDAFVTLSPGGATGGIATLVDAPSAPMWRILAGAALWPLALIGLWRGVVREDARPTQDAVSNAAGAGAADGWRSLGVAHSTVPRTLGERDVMPLLIPLIGAVAWASWAGMRSDPAGVADALAIARPFVAMFLGLGATAFALMPLGGEELASGRRAVPILVLVALLQFGLGAHHTYVGVQDKGRMASTKVARFVAGNVSRGGDVLTLGIGGLQVAWRLAPWPDLERVYRTSAAVPASSAALAKRLKNKPRRLVLVGDRWALEPQEGAGGDGAVSALHQRLTKAGYRLVEDGHRVLAHLSVRVYGAGEAAPEPSVVRPQLFPGKAP